MALLDLWRSSPDHLKGKQVDQVIAFAGRERLIDDDDGSSTGFREFLAAIDSELLATFAVECLTKKFEDAGFALQDIVNEIGERIGFQIQRGRYRGVVGQVGNDGLWTADGRSIIVEVKTTDVYRLPLKTLAGYRATLVKERRVELETSSMLIVVGRQETGELEEQVRGSRYAWDIRLISVDALLKLLRLSDRADDPGIVRRIRQVLIPHEFTRVDDIITMAFSAFEDARSEVPEAEGLETADANLPAIPSLAPVVNEASMARVEKHLEVRLKKNSRTIYLDDRTDTCVVCLVSKEYDRVPPYFWFGFHPYHQEALVAARNGYVALRCGTEATLLLIPSRSFSEWLPGMNKTSLADRSYWHIQVIRRGQRLELHQKQGGPPVDLTAYLLPDGQ